MKSAMFSIFLRNFRTGALFAATAVLGGCVQTTPIGGAPPQQEVWVARLVYSCANGSILNVTRAQGSTSALVRVDGMSYQLPRDATVTGAEHYTTRLQTLTLQGHSARFVGVGLTTYEPCTSNSTPVLLEAPRPGRGSQD